MSDELTEELTPEEKRAINALKRLAKSWPESLWLFANGSLSVMKKRDGARVSAGVGKEYDQEAMVATIDIENDGGDF